MQEHRAARQGGQSDSFVAVIGCYLGSPEKLRTSMALTSSSAQEKFNLVTPRGPAERSEGDFDAVVERGEIGGRPILR